MKHRPLILVLAAASCLSAVHAAPPPGELIPRDPAHLSIRNEVQLAIDKGLRWLQEQQKPEGWWSTPDHPAITSLVLTAHLRAPGDEFRKSPPPFIEKGYAWLLSNATPEGAIYVKEKGLSNYNTSISLMALLAKGDEKHHDAIRKAREFTVGMQAKGLADSSLDGGIGYGPGATTRQHPDMSNTLMALEALYHTKVLPGEELAAGKDLDWQAVIGFIERSQNLPEHNKEKWASGDAENKGGFVYFPGHSFAGETELPDGKKALRSYGSMTYAGLLSYIYADVKKDDPRVKAAIDWLERHYTLEENPGMGGEGLYYYYQVMAKGLAAAGIETLETKDGRKIDWRRELALKLIQEQKSEGFWVNDAGRWMEKDPVLVTAYAVLTLEILFRVM